MELFSDVDWLKVNWYCFEKMESEGVDIWKHREREVNRIYYYNWLDEYANNFGYRLPTVQLYSMRHEDFVNGLMSGWAFYQYMNGESFPSRVDRNLAEMDRSFICTWTKSDSWYFFQKFQAQDYDGAICFRCFKLEPETSITNIDDNFISFDKYRHNERDKFIGVLDSMEDVCEICKYGCLTRRSVNGIIYNNIDMHIQNYY